MTKRSWGSRRDFKLHLAAFDNEGRYSCGYSVFKDGDIYRMYYRGMSTEASQRTCCAESRDGIEWIRPDLGLCEFEGDELVLNSSTATAATANNRNTRAMHNGSVSTISSACAVSTWRIGPCSG